MKKLIKTTLLLVLLVPFFASARKGSNGEEVRTVMCKANSCTETFCDCSWFIKDDDSQIMATGNLPACQCSGQHDNPPKLMEVRGNFVGESYHKKFEVKSILKK